MHGGTEKKMRGKEAQIFWPIHLYVLTCKHMHVLIVTMNSKTLWLMILHNALII